MKKNSSKRAYQLVKDSTCVKQGKATNPRPFGKMSHRRMRNTEPMDRILFELYNHKISGDPSVLNCPQTDTENEHPILLKEVDAAVQSLKKGKSAGVGTSQQNWSK